ncbi:hypothetical protein GCM10007415_02550 [Parapedobacter pyrenivorans]|uniref:Uncharacterized protein n=1 Tax=Parapedobacter pyrenivorans TaxID=1305674 RepID=A0A917M301_9SPHI|nr:hypothetical protein [Parapedobacter pyrenivorans]GGG74536.1 hypothetical protein GCM10007415_02550 [Parapedobacter pyrenivorans]
MAKGFLILHSLLFLAFDPQPAVFYSSPTLRSERLDPAHYEFEYTIKDDYGQPMSVVALTGDSGTRYWYRRIFTPVCLTGECRPVDIGIYWHFTGKYVGIEVYGEPLTKTDHSEFAPLDYARLENILQNEWSDLREYTAEELVEPSGNVSEELDGVSGATKQAVSEAAVKDAVYTTHTIWHLIHVGEPEQLSLLALGKTAENPSIAHELLAAPNTANRNFVLNGVIDGNLPSDPTIERTVLEGLTSTDKSLRSLSFKALTGLNLADKTVQDGLAIAYLQLEASEKVRVLTPLERATELHPALRATLLAEFTTATQPWVLIKILTLLEQSRTPLTAAERKKISKVVDTQHAPLKAALSNFLKNR